MKKTEYEKGYEAGYHDGTKDCQKLYGKILDYVCSMFQEKKKEDRERIDRYKKRRKMIEKALYQARYGMDTIVINKKLKVGDVVILKSHLVLDVCLVKSTSPLQIYSRSTKYDFYEKPREFKGIEHYNLYYSGINMSFTEWKRVSLDANAEEVCKKLGISYQMVE